MDAKIWIALLVAVVVVGLAMSLFGKNTNRGDRTKLQVALSPAEQHLIDTVTVSRAELAQATCGGGARCWVAVNGIVYDLAGMKGWSSGSHHGVRAGTDATEQFVGSRHDKTTLEGVPVVGRLG